MWKPRAAASIGETSPMAMLYLFLALNLFLPPANTVKSRFSPPAGYQRVSCPPASFGGYLQNLALKPAGAPVKYYNGQEKRKPVYAAVLATDIGDKNLQQCADAIIRLRAEYFYARKSYDSISFPLTNGFEVPYRLWRSGHRVQVKGGQCSWKKVSAPSDSYAGFRAYLNFVFNYAGTISLNKQLHPRKLADISIGDVFITGGSPGHAIIVLDMAVNKQGQKVFLLAQSYMPAQDIHILKNYSRPDLGPWYSLQDGQSLETPEWTFPAGQLKTW